MGVGIKSDDVDVMKKLLKYFGLTDSLNLVNLSKGTTVSEISKWWS